MANTRMIVGLTLCGLFLCACAGSEQPPRHGHQGGRHAHPQGSTPAPEPVISADVFLFLPYGSDHDHRITKSELDAAIAGSWRELAGGQREVRLLALQDWFEKVEGAAATPFNPLEFAADGSETVSREEFAKALTRRFRALDKNGDGVLEPSDFMTVPRVQREGEGGGRMRQDGGPGGGPF